MNTIRKILSAGALIIIVAGFYGFFLAGSNSKGGNCQEELPLNKIQGIIVNPYGIYVGLGYYSRIQKYDHQGNFVGCWKTNTYSKEYSFSVNSYGEPEVVNWRINRKNIRNFIESDQINNETRDVLLSLETTKQELNPLEFVDSDGSVYRINDGFFKQLTKDKDGESSIIISQTLSQSFFSGYETAWTFGAFGILFFVVINSNIIIRNIPSDKRKLSILKILAEIFR